MEPEIIHLSVLTFLAGVFCKIYDDLNDNNLFEKHSFLLKNKEYINETLKGLHYILLTYASSKYIYLLFVILITCIVSVIWDKKAFQMPYEYSILIVFSLFSVYLFSLHFDQLMIITSMVKSIIYFAVSIYIVDIILCPNTVEFGYKKLVLRFLGSISLLLVFLANHFYKFCPDEILYCIWYLIGYAVTSCCFQIYLIWDSEKNAIIKDYDEDDEDDEDDKDDKDDEDNKDDKEPVKYIARSAKV